VQKNKEKKKKKWVRSEKKGAYFVLKWERYSGGYTPPVPSRVSVPPLLNGT